MYTVFHMMFAGLIFFFLREVLLVLRLFVFCGGFCLFVVCFVFCCFFLLLNLFILIYDISASDFF